MLARSCCCLLGNTADFLSTTAATVYKCEAVWKEELEEKYQVTVSLNTSNVITKIGPPHGGTIFATKSTVTCEDLDGVHTFINVCATLVIVLGIAMSIWLMISNQSSFIQMTSPILG